MNEFPGDVRKTKMSERPQKKAVLIHLNGPSHFSKLITKAVNAETERYKFPVE